MLRVVVFLLLVMLPLPLIANNKEETEEFHAN